MYSYKHDSNVKYQMANSIKRTYDNFRNNIQIVNKTLKKSIIKYIFQICFISNSKITLQTLAFLQKC